jgi:hypothetical protein
MQSSIYAQIRKENEDFYNSSISVVPGYSFNQYETLKRAHLYLNSKYENGGTYLNRELIFYNITTAPCEVATKMLNVDTKNIRLWPTNPKSYFSTYLLEKELKLWLKTSKMGALLNKIAEDAPKYGSFVLEKTKDGAEAVDLRKLILDPTVERVKNSRFITTIHYMTPSQLRETGWDNVDVAIERFGQSQLPESFEDGQGNMNQLQSTPYIKVYKRYGEVPKWWIDGGRSEETVRALFIVAGADVQEVNDQKQVVGEAGVTLFKSRWYKEWPYKDFHYTRVPGRWLGLGIPEMLFDMQTRVNELKNAKRFSMELSSIHLFQTKDKTVVRNVLTDLQNGDLIRSPSGIEPVANEERNLSAFKDEEESYMTQADRITFAYEAVSGQSLPSSTPATNALIATQQATNVFAFKRENLTLFLQEFFNDLVMPQLMKDLTPEHIMRFTGSAQELLKLDKAAAEIIANDYIKDRLLSGQFIEPSDVEALKQQAIERYQRLGENRFVRVKDAFYDDAEFEFDFIIGNEQADPNIMVQNTLAVLTPLLQNYGLQDPRVKMLYFKYAEQLGVSPAEMELADQQATEQQQQVNQQMGLPPGMPMPPQQDQSQPNPMQAPVQQL